MSIISQKALVAALFNKHRPTDPDERSEGDTPVCGCGHDLGWDETWDEHLAQVLAEWILKQMAGAWTVGFDDGYEEALFVTRGTPWDPDAHTFPRKNPYRIGDA